MTTSGKANSRMKDYFDLFTLLSEPQLRLVSITLAVRRTFERRKTPFPEMAPLGLTAEFASDPTKIIQWKAFLGKNKLSAPPLDHVVALIRERFDAIMIQAEGFSQPPRAGTSGLTPPRA